MLDFLFTPETQGADGSRAGAVVQRTLVRGDVTELRRVAAELGPGEATAFVIRLDLRLRARLASLAMFRLRIHRIERELARAGAAIVARYGVDPHLEAPACVYELGTTASIYADCYLRPRGRWLAARRVAAWCFGCDPALGAVILIVRKT